MKKRKNKNQLKTKKTIIKALEVLIEVVKTSKKIETSSISIEHETKPVENIGVDMDYKELLPELKGWKNLKFFIKYEI